MATNKCFNLIEIALAIGILSVGIVIIMSLFPVGVNENRKSVGINYSAIVAESIFSYISREANEPSNWDATLNLLPCSASVNTPPIILKPDGKLDPSTWITPGEGYIYKIADRDINDNLCTAGVYGIKIKTGDIIDFTAEALIWRQLFYAPSSTTPFYLKDLYVSGYTEDFDTSIDNSIRLEQIEKLITGINIEISWPAEKPYSQRNKNRYYFEVFNFGNVVPGGVTDKGSGPKK